MRVKIICPYVMIQCRQKYALVLLNVLSMWDMHEQWNKDIDNMHNHGYNDQSIWVGNQVKALNHFNMFGQVSYQIKRTYIV